MASAHHAAVVVDDDIWVIGGHSSTAYIQGAVRLFRRDSGDGKEWVAMTPQLRDPDKLLWISGAAAVCHPERQHCVLVFGGCRPPEHAEPGVTNDMLLLDTRRLEVTKLEVEGRLPAARLYHTMEVVGDRCVVFGGSTRQRPLPPQAALAVFEVQHNRWLQVDASQLDGPYPGCLKGHRAAAVGSSRMVLAGGAGTGRSGVRGAALPLHMLHFGKGGTAAWEDLNLQAYASCDASAGRGASSGARLPPPLEFATLNLVDNRLVLLGGHCKHAGGQAAGGAGLSTNGYSRCTWLLDLLHLLIAESHPDDAPAAPAALPAPPPSGAVGKRRRGAARVPKPASKRQAPMHGGWTRRNRTCGSPASEDGGSSAAAELDLMLHTSSSPEAEASAEGAEGGAEDAGGLQPEAHEPRQDARLPPEPAPRRAAAAPRETQRLQQEVDALKAALRAAAEHKAGAAPPRGRMSCRAQNRQNPAERATGEGMVQEAAATLRQQVRREAEEAAQQREQLRKQLEEERRQRTAAQAQATGLQLELESGSASLGRLQQERAELRQQLQSSREEAGRLQQERAELRQQLQSSREEARRQAAACAEAEAGAAALREEVRAEREAWNAERRRAAAAQRAAEARQQGQIEELASKAAAAAAEAAAAEKRSCELRNQLQQTEKDSAAAQRTSTEQLEKLQADLEGEWRALEMGRKRELDYQTENRQLGEELRQAHTVSNARERELKRVNMNLKRVQHEAHTEIDQLQGQLSVAKQEAKKHQERAAAVDEERRAVQVQLASTQAEATRLESAKLEAECGVANLQKTIERRDTQIEALQGFVRSINHVVTQHACLMPPPRTSTAAAQSPQAPSRAPLGDGDGASHRPS